MNPEVRELVRTMLPIVRWDWLDQLRPTTGRMVDFYGHDVVDHELVEMMESRTSRS